MKAEVVTCDDEVRAFYYYKKSEPPKPIEYPCVMSESDNDGGLMGSYRSYKFHYAPSTIPTSLTGLYFAGLIEGLSYAD